MKKFTTSALLAISATLAMVSITPANALPTSFDQMSHVEMKGKKFGKYKKHHRGFMKKAFAQLNLSETQQNQIKAIKDAQRAERKANRKARKAQRKQTKALMNGNSLDSSQLDALANKHAQQAKARFIKRATTRQAIAQILTAEQRSKLAQIKAEHTQNKRARRANK